MGNQVTTVKEQRPGSVWVFSGNRNHFPSAVFSTRELAQAWIRERGLTGTLTEYPVDLPIYDWAVGNGYFKPKRDDQTTPDFQANFSAAQQDHYHFTNGKLAGE